VNLVKLLAGYLSKTEAQVSQFLTDAPLKYKVYTIPKRTSGRRVIAQPSRELKEYQRAFLSLVHLPVHDAAMAYKKRISIKNNAMVHQKNPYLLKLDLANFFNSISNELFWDIWEKHYQLPLSLEQRYLEKLLFWQPSKMSAGKLVLSIGAPSSPHLSNFLMYHFDEELTQVCLKFGVKYTRYADDLTFSTTEKGRLFQFPKIVSDILQQQFGSALVINRRKTVFSSKAHNRHITGITITNDKKLSLGRNRKRYIKHLVHQYLMDQLSQDDFIHLRGMLAFAKHIEPGFIRQLESKYSPSTIVQIFEEKNE